MWFILVVMVFFPADAKSDEQSQEEYILPGWMETVFKRLHKPYNAFLRWDGALAAEALEEAMSTFRAEDIDLRIRAQREFSTEENRTLRPTSMVTMTLKSYLLENAQKLKRLPEGTNYGCGGIFNTKGGDNLMSVTCLYYYFFL
ncbi:hypothetical protein TELCIR_00005 [Teladorsagia circumcincta]|uniref:SCP domain-containing protein n=1 Tax=Teladorsagia circumcincta TaxID=45464 RepID=A0A2G9V5Z5_TELCI|nr:hypothetical protein TELCIR_00005 [Teladorsagia circumcincta]